MAILHLDTANAAAIDENLFHPGVGEHLAAGTLYFRDNAVGNAPAAANRVITAIEIVARDHRVRHERRLLRRQAHVAPLTAKYRDQILVIGQFI